jgi:hypothetical protein
MDESSVTCPRYLPQERDEFRNEARAAEAETLTHPPVFHVDLIRPQIDEFVVEIKTFLKT